MSEKIDFTKDSEYIRLYGDEDDSEEFMESVYKSELGTNFEKVESGVGIAALPDYLVSLSPLYNGMRK